MTVLPPLILGSTSRYRRELLERLRLPFTAEAPRVDETPLPGEAPAALATRLALAKAREVASRHPGAVVIGSDQVADVDGEAIGKPGTHERAAAQLRRMSGRAVVFQTAVAVVRTDSGFEQVERVPVTVRFRDLDDDEIEHYLRLEQPYDCAGSAKCETLGIALLSAIESDDPTALVGLPLIRTSALLRAAGIDPLRGARMSAPAGRLVLVPSALDLGTTPTPITEVLSHGAITRAAGIGHWVVENAKAARAFLKRVGEVVPLAQPLQGLAITELPRPRKGVPADDTDARAWEALLAPALAGQSLGLLSDAGLPAVADPGARLVAAAHMRGVAVEVLAGASSLTLALAASGLNGQRFAFEGYLPQDAAERARRVKALEQRSRQEGQTQLVIETPYRNQALAEALLATLQPGTRLSLACGLTSPGGFCATRTVADWRRQPPVLPDTLPAVFLWLA